MEKKIIFHIPFFVDEKRKSGSHIRPLKMLNAFKNFGYSVDCVTGYGKERKKSIAQIKKNIEKGINYEFCYSESSTMPTLLTEKNHIPKYFNLDFNFFKYLKDKNIPIGLFYRDCYWAFPNYQDGVSKLKKAVSKKFYLSDLKNYNKFVDILYLPNKKMNDYLPLPFKKTIKELPPGIDELDDMEKQTEFSDFKNKKLKLFYVGGLSFLYDLKLLVETVSCDDRIELTICTRQNEWEGVKDDYLPIMNENIKVIHKSGFEFKEDIENSNICILYFKPSEYRKFAMPVKLFEYMSYEKPILATKGSSVGDFVEKNKMGFSIDYEKEELKNTLNEILSNPSLLKERVENIRNIKIKNTWSYRAKTVAKDLTERKKL